MNARGRRLLAGVVLGFGLLFCLGYMKNADTASLDVTTDYGIYTDNGGARVFTPVLKLATNLGAGTDLMLRYSVDSVSAASRDATLSKTHADRGANCSACHLAPNVITGATKAFDEDRQEAVANITTKWGENTASVRYVNSRERDYTSNAAIVTYARQFFERNTTVSATLKKNWDDVSFVILPGNSFHKNTFGVEGGLTHTISPTTLIGAGYGYEQNTGQLGLLYEFVDLNGLPRSQIVPQTKRRRFYTAKWNQSLPWRSSTQTSYRYYFDDWGIISRTISVSLYKYITDALVITPSYRYYVQSGAYFYRDHFTTELPLMSSDYNLRPFKAQTLGLRGMIWLNPLISLELGYDRYAQFSDADYRFGFRDKDLRADIYQTELSVKFK